MCGRYIPNTEMEITEIKEIFGQLSLALSPVLINTADVYPTQTAPVIYFKDKDTAIYEKAKWGFSKWDGKGVVINAKSETAEMSRFFNRYTKNNRCIISAHGYYEWLTMPDKTKIKYTFTNSFGKGIFMAGIYKPSPEINEFVILTKNANIDIEFIHNRMPLILKTEQIKPWLAGEGNITAFQEETYDDLTYEEAV